MCSMSLLSWNCQGLGSTLTIHHLIDLNKRYDPNIIFLMETKKGDAYCEMIRMRVGMDNKEYINPRVVSGDIAMLWMMESKVEVLSTSHNFIDYEVSINQLDEPIFVTWVYADTEPHKCTQNWETVREIGRNQRGKWIVLREFNSICHPHENEGGRVKPKGHMDEFKKLIEDLNMEDMGENGQPFTWSNNRSGDERIIERLDRDLVNKEVKKFSKATQHAFV